MFRKMMILVMVLGALAAVSRTDWMQVGDTAVAAEALVPERPWEVIEVAIALDTSGSME